MDLLHFAQFCSILLSPIPRFEGWDEFSVSVHFGVFLDHLRVNWVLGSAGACTAATKRVFPVGQVNSTLSLSLRRL